MARPRLLITDVASVFVGRGIAGLAALVVLVTPAARAASEEWSPRPATATKRVALDT